VECGAGDMYAQEENSIYFIEEYVKNNFYKNYTISAYFSRFIKNDSIDDNPTPTYNLLKNGSFLGIAPDDENACEIKALETEETYYKLYSLTPKSNYFKICCDCDNTIIYEHGKLIDLANLILPQEKSEKIDVNKLINVYTPHTLFEKADNLKQMLYTIFDNKDVLSKIINKGDSFISDNIDFNTCYIDKLISYMEMIGEKPDKYNIDSFEKVNELRDIMRIFSMNYSKLFGNLYKEAIDIKIGNNSIGKNVGEKLKEDSLIYCDKDYNILAIYQDGELKKIKKEIKTPNIIVYDNFSTGSTLVSFHEVPTYEYANFANLGLDENWAKLNSELINETVYCFNINDYDSSWAWGLLLPPENKNMNNKKYLVHNYYSFYLFNPQVEIKRKYNFLDELTIPDDEKAPDKQISRENWDKDYGFMHHCLMKILIDKLDIK
jgi:hypothetical protein